MATTTMSIKIDTWRRFNALKTKPIDNDDLLNLLIDCYEKEGTQS